MNWKEQKVTLYQNHEDTRGKEVSIGQILTTLFAVPHVYWLQGKGLCPPANDLGTMLELRKLDKNSPDYDKQSKPLKATLQAFTIANLESRKKDHVKIKSRTNLMQIDFDHAAVKDYDIEELKQKVFKLDFVAYCGRSCSGFGFYCLAVIEEPEKLEEYAEHVQQIFRRYGIVPDSTKGKKVSDLRYVSYDQHFLMRDNPTPLKIKKFIEIKKVTPATYTDRTHINGSGLLVWATRLIQNAVNGSRFDAVRKAAYTIGGLPDSTDRDLEQLKDTVRSSPQYQGYEAHCFRTADEGFRDGKLKPISKN